MSIELDFRRWEFPDDADGLVAANTYDAEKTQATQYDAEKELAESGFQISSIPNLVKGRKVAKPFISTDLLPEESVLQEEHLGNDLGVEAWDGYVTRDDGRKFLVGDFYASSHEQNVAHYDMNVFSPRVAREEQQLDSQPIQERVINENVPLKYKKPKFRHLPKGMDYGLSRRRDREELEPIRIKRREAARSDLRRVLAEETLLTGKAFTPPAKSPEDTELAALEARYAEEIKNGGRSSAVILAAKISTLEARMKGNIIR